VDEFIELVELLGAAEIGPGDKAHRMGYTDGNHEVSGQTSSATVPFRKYSSEKPAPVFDLADAVKKCFGKYEFFVDMAKSFSEEAGTCIGAMKEARLQNNTGVVREAAHRLKNTVMYLGSGPAMCAIVDVENAAKSGDLIALDNALPQLELRIESLKQSLAEHCQL
jgi:hypothetical protein